MQADSDPATQFLWGATPDEAPEHPTALGLYKRLKLYAGRNATGQAGPLPFLYGGGYLNQPYITSLTLETCIRAEREFEFLQRISASVPAQHPQQRQPESG